MEARVPVWTIDRFHEEYSGSVARLGVGGFGVVHLVHDRSGKKRAAKVVQILDDQGKASLRREVQVLWELRASGGEHALYMVDYFEQGAQGLLVTEYLSGGELFSRCSRRDYRFTETKCKLFTSSLLKAVAFIHSAGIIHLDIKPNNIVCVSRAESNLQVKIIDFGLAKDIQGESDVAINQCGTPEFMAPEVMKCTRASPLSDIWSLGVVIFMLITGGFSPFYSRNQYKMQRKILRGNYNIEHEAFAGISRQAKDLVRSLLVVDPAGRLSARQCLDHIWLASVNGSDSSLSELRRLETEAMRRWLARRRWTRVYNAVVATLRLAARTPTPSSEPEVENGSADYFSTEQEIWL